MARLTAAVVKSANAPGLIWDEAVKGFCLRTYPSGAKSFLLSYWVNGRERRYTIGNFPTWTLEAARLEAKALRRRIDQGGDPIQEKRERREAPTVRDLIDRYIAEHLPTKVDRDPHRKNDELKMLAHIGEHLGLDRKVAEIHFGDIQAMHRAISTTPTKRKPNGRPVAANRYLALASVMFSLSLKPMAGEANAWRDPVRGNPCKGVARNRETARERFFSTAEIAAISDALAAYGKLSTTVTGTVSAQAAADCVRLIMLAGCRAREARRATWEQFDVEPGFWVKRSAHTKQRKTHKVPLNPAALELVERLRKHRKLGATWVFPGQKPGEPLQQLQSVWNWVRERTGFGLNERIYDLRHTFASVGAGGGLSLPIIGKLLGHTQARTTMRYAHLADDPLREATEKIGAVIAGAGKGGADVVRLREKGGR
jgi:integrase